MSTCTDSVVGDILSSWRYDISGISPEMRIDYEEHLATCAFCRSRQRLHRTIDVALISLSTLCILAFLLALAFDGAQLVDRGGGVRCGRVGRTKPRPSVGRREPVTTGLHFS